MVEDSDDTTGSSGESRREGRRKELRGKIQRSIEFAKEEQRRELLRHRIEVAKRGLSEFNAKKYPEAVTSFITYIRILEDWKQVAPGGLHPNNFDIKKDVAELMLINSVYWHLVKLFDRGRGAEFTAYMQKFILFTKGMTFQPLASEALRKYLRGSKVLHKNEMRSAYRMITGARCFVATSLIDHVEPGTIPALRKFRDDVLHGSRYGRRFVYAYYRTGPMMASALDRMPETIRRWVAISLDRVAQLLTILRTKKT